MPGGDGIVNGAEERDHGADNGKVGSCSNACKVIIYAPPQGGGALPAW